MRTASISLGKCVTICNELGLHARSAAKIAKQAREAKSKVWIVKGDERADAKSILDVVSLSCHKGTDICIEIESSVDLPILEKLVALVLSGFGE